MADSRQGGLLDLLSHVDKPIQPELELRDVAGASLVPTAEEALTIRSNLDLQSQGIGLAPRGRPCSLFEWENMAEAMALARLFTRQASYDEFVKVSVSVRTFVNEEIYVFAMMYAVIHRRDTRTLQLPPVEEVLPYWYFPSTVISEADHRVKEAATPDMEIVVPYSFAHTELDPEFRIAYFREDIGLNSHHWHWHVAYPFTWTPEDANDIKDRKGELFYYMHHQVIARYDAERLSNSLGRVTTLSDFRSAFEEGYFPNLMSTISGRNYAARQANTLPRDTADITIERMILWKTRIMDAIHTASVIDRSGNKQKLEEPRGIDILGDIVEAAAISVNRDFYGDYHNFGHRLIARVHDPDGRFGGERGVMAFSATAMRDPIFYKWHKAIDDLFNEYKVTQPPYTRQELEWSDIRISNISVTGNSSKRNNFLQTFWQDREVLLSRGVDFGRPNPVSVSFRHLQHEEFVYDIEIDNTSKADRQLVVRIFLSPVSDEFNEPLTFAEQRLLFIELEKYQINVKPGKQVLKRRSEDSNVTLPSVKGFALLGQPDPSQPPTTVEGFCGCGWPSHLLIPKGRPEGMRFVLLVMITDWEKDKVDSLPEKTCGDAASYCGIRDQRYPDKRTMGFPFDRRFRVGESIESFASMTNVATKEIIIRHSAEIFEDPVKMCEDRQQYILDLVTQAGKPLPSDCAVSVDFKGRSWKPSQEDLAKDESITPSPREEFCSSFDKKVMKEMMFYSDLLTNQKTFEDFILAAVYFRPKVNEHVLVEAIARAVLNRKDTRTLRVPPMEEMMPYWIFPDSVLKKARDEVEKAATSKKIVVDYNPSVNEEDPEGKLSYFREDIGANSHHWHWHLAYPYGRKEHDKDRGGELFYYMHRQLLARYDTERMSNGLSRTTPLAEFSLDTVLEEGYDADLNATNGGRNYVPRPANTGLQHAEESEIENMKQFKKRILEAIDNGFIYDKNMRKKGLDDSTGIDVLGNIIESSDVSDNSEYYGQYHNSGHVIIGLAHVPDGYLLIKDEGKHLGVMANVGTAMRDPIFYRWHKHIDDLFTKYKRTIPRYTRETLEWRDIGIHDVTVRGDFGERLNELETFWAKREVLLSRGYDFKRVNPVFANVTHLQHEEFEYRIDINNTYGCERQLLVRIFLVPKTDENDEPLTFEEQCPLFIELDKYNVSVQPGRQVLKRRSEDSNVTVDPPRGFFDLGNPSKCDELNKLRSFCGCGWPQNLLIPKGTPEGRDFVLFVMITDWDKDKACDVLNKVCGDAASYCGVRDQKYPDKRAMGFPFDRRFKFGETLESFARMSNVAIKEITIRHRDSSEGEEACQPRGRQDNGCNPSGRPYCQ